jgi:hypothetical protein
MAQQEAKRAFLYLCDRRSKAAGHRAKSFDQAKYAVHWKSITMPMATPVDSPNALRYMSGHASWGPACCGVLCPCSKIAEAEAAVSVNERSG